jgi:spore coat protein U-like protein
MRFKFFAAAAIAAVCAAAPAGATQLSDSFDVTLTIADGCVLTLPSTLSFGSVSYLDQSATASADMAIKCTAGTNATISLDAGQGTGASTATRYLQNGSEQIEYSLYKDSSHTQIWGSLNGERTLHTGNGSEASLTVYGSTVASGTTPSAGEYTDTITVTVDY